ncbi:hypothetical protein FB567DRAFT_574280 [Paraphoma chrysanthemicola]|uniref:BTB domain-containing protein n=1 Tax=Paraphoma chrysanthemicola TaxID=798071 RepID=A0A8K0VQS5_9PLEO|nr:hypothetical protein FB567DRAFT_574280 [Paraphoma chrysanthemicola]
MPIRSYNIDAKADTKIVLKNPNTSFAPWTQAEISDDSIALNNESSAIASAPEDADQGASVEVAVSADNTSVPNSVEPEEDEVWYYVSRRHLVSSSPTLDRMISGAVWKEGNRDESDGLYHVPAEDWDAEALLYVLQVLHLRNGQVPRTVSLEMLAKITRWVERLRVTSPVPSFLCRDLMLWMCIAWVLKLPQEFEQTTTVAMRREDQELPSLGLPITICVDRIETLRTQAIGTVLSRLHELLEQYRSPLYQCPGDDSFECGSMLYGALYKQMELQGLLPVPTAPYHDLSVSELYTKMERIKSPVWGRPSKHSKKTQQHGCNLAERVMGIANHVTRLANGPKLEDFEVR